MSRASFWSWLLFACLCGSWQSAHIRAQPAVTNTQTTPPSVVRLLPIRLPADAALPLQMHLDLLVLIDPQGHARLDQTLEPEALQLAAVAALELSEFKPASQHDVPVLARVQLRVPLLSTQADRADSPAVVVATPELAPSSEPSVDARNTSRAGVLSYTMQPEAASPTFGASARVTQPVVPTGRRLELQEMRNLPGAFGDPFRVLDALPGVVPALSGLPYVYVRGAPPAGTLYFYDGIQVPGMFHLALGPAVVHPALIDEVDFYASVAPARYGRFTGGVLSGGPSPRPPPTRTSGELELRLIDITGKLEIPVAGGSLSLSGRYGYPGPVIAIFSPQSTLNYWDYQTRLILPFAQHKRFEFVWFGSYDSAGFTDSRGQRSEFVLEFHRAEARLIQQFGAVEVGTTLQIGYEHSEIDTGLRVRAFRLGPRAYLSYRSASGWRFRIGADLFGSVGSLHAAPSIEEGPIQIRVPFADDVAGRSMMGAYSELSIPVTERLRLDLGLRGDLWLTGSRADYAADPRLSVAYRASDVVSLHVAAGLAHQPSVFLVPLPGIADVGVGDGLQSAVQSEAGVAFELPASFKFETQAYAQRFSNMILPELALDQTNDCAGLPVEVEAATSRCNGGYPRSTIWAYGLEFFLRRAVTEQLSGWLNYTLGWARAHTDAGEKFRPTFDVRHVLNLVLQYRFGSGFSTGGRVQYRSGKLASEIFLREEQIRYEQRLPGFFRADLHVSYGWRPSWGSLRVTVEWFNLTLSREATDIACRDGVGVGANPLLVTPCQVQRAPALFFPNLGIRAEF